MSVRLLLLSNLYKAEKISFFVYVEVKITPVETFRGSFSKEIVVV